MKERLEELRQELRNECISYGELSELASLVDYIEPGDVELLEAAGVPEEVVFLQAELDELIRKWEQDNPNDNITPYEEYPGYNYLKEQIYELKHPIA